jgi:hypothetical protein
MLQEAIELKILVFEKLNYTSFGKSFRKETIF